MKRTGIAVTVLTLVAGVLTVAATPVVADSASKPAAPRSAERLIIGSLLPQSGFLDFLEPPMRAAYRAALRDINAAGGVLGKPVRGLEADSGDSGTDLVTKSLTRLVNDGAQVIIGPATSSGVRSVLEGAIARDRLIFSPSATSDDLSQESFTQGHFARMMVPDSAEGRWLAALAKRSPALTRIAILAVRDPFGEGVASTLDAALRAEAAAADRNLSITRVDYDYGTENFAAQVAEIKVANPQAVVVIGFEESAAIVEEMLAQGLRPGRGAGRIQLILSSSTMPGDFWQDLPSPVLRGLSWISVGTTAPKALKDRMSREVSGLSDFAFGAETYDAVIITALAAQHAGSTKASDIAAAIPSVTGGKKSCSSYKECLSLLRKGRSIQYLGWTGARDFLANGDPGTAELESTSFTAAGKPKVTRLTGSHEPA